MEVKVKKIEGFEDLLSVLKEVFEDLVTPKNSVNKKEYKKALKEKAIAKNKITEEDIINKYRVMVLNSIANKKGWSTEDVNKWLFKISVHHPMVVVNIVLYEMSRILDHKYEGLISDTETVYMISSLNGAVIEVPVKHIKNFRVVSAFRTKEDAELAKKVSSIRKLLKHGGK